MNMSNLTAKEVLLEWLLKKFTTAKTIVIVPTDYLVNQWIIRLQGYDNWSVHTWHSLYKSETIIDCDLLVIDEIHSLILTTEYVKVLDVINAKWTVGLSGTLNDDHLFALKQRNFPISDIVTEEEAKQLDAIAETIEYNLPIQLSYLDSQYLKNLDNEYRQKLLFLDANIEDPTDYDGNADFSVLERLSKPIVTGFKGSPYDFIIPVDAYHPDYKRLYEKVKNDNLANIVRYKTGTYAGQIREIKEYRNVPIIAQLRGVDEFTITRYIKRCREILNLRKSFFYNHPSKIEMVKNLVEVVFPTRKGFTFSMEAQFCDKLTESLPNVSRSYHNSLQTRSEEITIETTSKSGKVKSVTKTVKIGKDRLLKRVIEEFDNPESAVRVLNTIRKIEAGADFKGASFVIHVGYYSKWVAYQQKNARANRKEGDKVSHSISLYCKFHPAFSGMTQEELWLRRAQKNSTNVKWINNINQIE